MPCTFQFDVRAQALANCKFLFGPETEILTTSSKDGYHLMAMGLDHNTDTWECAIKNEKVHHELADATTAFHKISAAQVALWLTNRSRYERKPAWSVLGDGLNRDEGGTHINGHVFQKTMADGNQVTSQREIYEEHNCSRDEITCTDKFSAQEEAAPLAEPEIEAEECINEVSAASEPALEAIPSEVELVSYPDEPPLEDTTARSPSTQILAEDPVPEPEQRTKAIEPEVWSWSFSTRKIAKSNLFIRPPVAMTEAVGAEDEILCDSPKDQTVSFATKEPVYEVKEDEVVAEEATVPADPEPAIDLWCGSRSKRKKGKMKAVSPWPDTWTVVEEPNAYAVIQGNGWWDAKSEDLVTQYLVDEPLVAQLDLAAAEDVVVDQYAHELLVEDRLDTDPVVEIACVDVDGDNLSDSFQFTAKKKTKKARKHARSSWLIEDNLTKEDDCAPEKEDDFSLEKIDDCPLEVVSEETLAEPAIEESQSEVAVEATDADNLRVAINVVDTVRETVKLVEPEPEARERSTDPEEQSDSYKRRDVCLRIEYRSTTYVHCATLRSTTKSSILDVARKVVELKAQEKWRGGRGKREYRLTYASGTDGPISISDLDEGDWSEWLNYFASQSLNKIPQLTIKVVESIALW